MMRGRSSSSRGLAKQRLLMNQSSPQTLVYPEREIPKRFSLRFLFNATSIAGLLAMLFRVFGWAALFCIAAIGVYLMISYVMVCVVQGDGKPRERCSNRTQTVRRASVWFWRFCMVAVLMGLFVFFIELLAVWTVWDV